MYYPNLTRSLRTKIMRRFPDARPLFTDVDHIKNDFGLVCYLLWMLDQLQTFEPNDVAKRGRWIGYIQGRMEARGFLTNAENRRLTKVDVQDMTCV